MLCYSENNTSAAQHVYLQLGTYTVTAQVSNKFYSIPVVVTLPTAFTVVKPIDSLHVQEATGRTAAELTPAPNGRRLYSTAPVKFTAMIAQGSDVVFSFDFGDGTVTHVTGVYNPLFWTTSASTSHVFAVNATSVASRQRLAVTVRVTAWNAVSRETVTLTDFVLQVALHGLAISYVPYTLIGRVTYLQASITSGTGVNFDWDLGNGSSLINAGTISFQSLSELQLPEMQTNK